MPRISAAFLIPVLVLSLVQAAPVPPAADRPPLYFPTRLGTTWVYESSDSPGESTASITDTKVEKGVTTVTVTWVGADGEPECRERVAVSGEGVSVVENDFLSPSDPPVRWVKSGAKAGERWTIDTMYKIGDSHIPIHATVTCVGVEKVKVPAGEFTAVRVRAKSSDWGPCGERWYAPGVGMVKWQLGPKSATLLKSFNSGKH